MRYPSKFSYNIFITDLFIYFIFLTINKNCILSSSLSLLLALYFSLFLYFFKKKKNHFKNPSNAPQAPLNSQTQSLHLILSLYLSLSLSLKSLILIHAFTIFALFHLMPQPLLHISYLVLLLLRHQACSSITRFADTSTTLGLQTCPLRF